MTILCACVCVACPSKKDVIPVGNGCKITYILFVVVYQFKTFLSNAGTVTIMRQILPRIHLLFAILSSVIVLTIM
jgi:hypothetical protein